jgi:23S rRNA G2445 N2-methylase RlmL
MKGLAITSKGIEDVTASDIQDILGVSSVISDTVCTFDCSSKVDLIKLAYRAQSVHRVLHLIDSFESADILHELTTRVSTWNLDDLKTPYTVTATRSGTHDFSSQDAVQTIKKIDGKTFTYKQYKGALHIHIRNNTCYVGLDIAGIDLSKRDYKIFPNPFSLRGPLAYAVYRQLEATGIISDPFCRDGTICIEAALHQKSQSPHFYRKNDFLCEFDLNALDVLTAPTAQIFAMDLSFPNIAAAKKNAKIANVHKEISFRRKSVDDFDLTFEPDTITGIMTSTQKSVSPLFERAGAVMPKGGRVAVLSMHNNPLPITDSFVQIRSKPVAAGKHVATLFVFEKQ